MHPPLSRHKFSEKINGLNAFMKLSRDAECERGCAELVHGGKFARGIIELHVIMKP